MGLAMKLVLSLIPSLFPSSSTLTWQWVTGSHLRMRCVSVCYCEGVYRWNRIVLHTNTMLDDPKLKIMSTLGIRMRIMCLTQSTWKVQSDKMAKLEALSCKSFLVTVMLLSFILLLSKWFSTVCSNTHTHTHTHNQTGDSFVHACKNCHMYVETWYHCRECDVSMPSPLAS